MLALFGAAPPSSRPELEYVWQIRIIACRALLGLVFVPSCSSLRHPLLIEYIQIRYHRQIDILFITPSGTPCIN
jgi:hypothetical protein